MRFREVSSGRTVILDDAYWEARDLPERDRFVSPWGVDNHSPLVEIPDQIFNDLFTGIQTYHEEGMKKPGLQGYEEPHVQALKTKIETVEKQLIDLLKSKGVDVNNYLWIKEIRSTT
jgi:hypothetical protein